MGKSHHHLQVVHVTRLMSGRDLCFHHLHVRQSPPLLLCHTHTHWWCVCVAQEPYSDCVRLYPWTPGVPHDVCAAFNGRHQSHMDGDTSLRGMRSFCPDRCCLRKISMSICRFLYRHLPEERKQKKFALSQHRNRFSRSGGCHGNSVNAALQFHSGLLENRLH